MEQELPDRRRIVVDGSNIATEGRTLPSLAQLDEAIHSFLEEYRGFSTSDVTVVVDASFGHRIDPSEVSAFEQAVDHGEMITPPAGAIGRGDGFILRIAEKSGALVLSNDSFQEFHAERPWLFEPGRLIGGKPVPGVGWIFTPRTPVRGARSRSVTSKSRRDDRAAEVEGADVATEPDELVAGGSTGGRGKATKVSKAAKKSVDGSPPSKATRATGGTTKASKATRAADLSQDAAGSPEADGSRAKAAPSTPSGDGAARGRRPAKAGAKKTAAAESAAPAKAGRARKGAEPAKASKAATKAAKTTKAAKAAKAPTKASKTTKATKAAMAGNVRADTTGPAPDPGSDAGARAAHDALNDPMTFLTFVAEHPVGSTFDGTVVSFTSHGAHVDVDGMLCHVPLRGLAVPPPNKARQVVSKGETRQFVLVSLDAARRRAELALPGVVP
jgi:hypothetical protein